MRNAGVPIKVGAPASFFYYFVGGVVDDVYLAGRAVSPIVAHSPGQRPGWTYAAINTFGIFASTQKCHAL